LIELINYKNVTNRKAGFLAFKTVIRTAQNECLYCVNANRTSDDAPWIYCTDPDDNVHSTPEKEKSGQFLYPMAFDPADKLNMCGNFKQDTSLPGVKITIKDSIKNQGQSRAGLPRSCRVCGQAIEGTAFLCQNCLDKKGSGLS
jgi:hypothetical protein